MPNLIGRTIKRTHKLLKKKVLPFFQNVYSEFRGFPIGIRYVHSKKDRGVYIGWLGNGNLGDEALFQAIQDIFSKDICFLGNWQNYFLLSCLLKQWKPKVIFLGGGTLIGADLYLKDLEFVRQVSPKSKVVVFGTGVRDVEMWKSFGVKTNMDIWKNVLRLSNFIGVRGPLSKTFLQTWELEPNKIQVIGDPVLWLARPKVKPKGRVKRIGINFGSSNGKVFGRDEAKVQQFGAHLLQALIADGWKITIFPMAKDDETYLLEMVRISCLEPLPIVNCYLDLEEVMARLEDQDVFIGEKLHSVVLATCVYTPAIMMEYRTKCRDFMQSIGWEAWTFRTDNLDLDVIFGCIHELYENLEMHQQQLFSVINDYRDRLEHAADQVRNVIRNG